MVDLTALERELQAELAKYDANVESKAFSFTRGFSPGFSSPDAAVNPDIETPLQEPLDNAAPSIVVTGSGNVVRSPGKSKGGSRSRRVHVDENQGPNRTISTAAAHDDSNDDDDGASTEERQLREMYYGTPLAPRSQPTAQQHAEIDPYIQAESCTFSTLAAVNTELYAASALAVKAQSTTSACTSHRTASPAPAAHPYCLPAKVNYNALRQRLLLEQAQADKSAALATREAVQAAVQACNAYWQQHLHQEKRRTRRVRQQRDAYKTAYHALQRECDGGDEVMYLRA